MALVGCPVEVCDTVVVASPSVLFVVVHANGTNSLADGGCI